MTRRTSILIIVALLVAMLFLLYMVCFYCVAVESEGSSKGA